MKRLMSVWLSVVLVATLLTGCQPADQEVKIGVSFGVGSAARWDNESGYMQERAAELGADIEVRMNRTDEPKTQQQDCFEMIDSGIDVLVLIPRDANKVGEILEYAKKKKVPVISYARAVLGQKVDLFVGYDSARIGQQIGQYMTEIAFEGDYILLRGDEGDNNATLLYEGALRYIDTIRDNLNIILDAPVPGWSADEAKKLVKQAIVSNGNKVDAILAPNDKIAGVCADVLVELGITDSVVITGMDAELEAAQRILAGTQTMTIYMDLEELSHTAITEANNMARGQKATVNAEFAINNGETVPANLITGKVVTRENLDKILIDSGYMTREQVYGVG